MVVFFYIDRRENRNRGVIEENKKRRRRQTKTFEQVVTPSRRTDQHRSYINREIFRYIVIHIVIGLYAYTIAAAITSQL